MFIAFIIGVLLAILVVGFESNRGPYMRVIYGWLDSHFFCAREARILNRWAASMGWWIQFSDETQTKAVTNLVANRVKHMVATLGM